MKTKIISILIVIMLLFISVYTISLFYYKSDPSKSYIEGSIQIPPNLSAHPQLTGLALNSIKNLIYVGVSGGGLLVISGKNNTVIYFTMLSKNYNIAFSPIGLYFDPSSDIIYYETLKNVGFDSFQPIILEFSSKSYKILNEITVPEILHTNPFSMILTRYKNTLFIPIFNNLYIFSLKNNSIIKTMKFTYLPPHALTPIPMDISALVIDHKSGLIYVGTDYDSFLFSINTKNYTIVDNRSLENTTILSMLIDDSSQRLYVLSTEGIIENGYETLWVLHVPSLTVLKKITINGSYFSSMTTNNKANTVFIQLTYNITLVSVKNYHISNIKYTNVSAWIFLICPIVYNDNTDTLYFLSWSEGINGTLLYIHFLSSSNNNIYLILLSIPLLFVSLFALFFYIRKTKKRQIA